MLKHRRLIEIEWNQPGTEVAGILVEARPLKFQDGGTNVAYLVFRSHDGAMVSFPGSAMLNKMLHRGDVGKEILVSYRGQDAAPVKQGMSPKKLFDVAVDDGIAEPDMPVGDESDPGPGDEHAPGETGF